MFTKVEGALTQEKAQRWKGHGKEGGTPASRNRPRKNPLLREAEISAMQKLR